MTSYTSIASYVLAVKLRSAKTILVEGITDKKVLKRVLLEHTIPSPGTPAYLIDDASMINDAVKLAGKGNKEKLLDVSEAFGETSNQFKYLADREWEGWNFTAPMTQDEPRPRNTGLLTKGHSIENYWFLESALAAYLKTAHPEHLTADFFQKLNTRFDEILRFAASYSLAVKDAQAITRCNALLSEIHILWDGDTYVLLDSFQDYLRTRGNEQQIYELWKERHLLLSTAGADTLQWLCHGHLGEEAIRCCTASLAKEFGVSRATLCAIERGSKSEKMAHDASHIAQLPQELIEPIGQLITWVKGADVAS